MPAGYGAPTDGSGGELLPWSWAAERLERARNYWISTTRADGRPHAAPVWALWLDDAVWFSTGADSQKARNMARDPRIVVHLESGDETVILEGLAEPVLDDDLERRVDEVYGPKYDFTPDSSGETDPWFVMRPKRAYAWTERSYPASATQFDFD